MCRWRGELGDMVIGSDCSYWCWLLVSTDSLRASREWGRERWLSIMMFIVFLYWPITGKGGLAWYMERQITSLVAGRQWRVSMDSGYIKEELREKNSLNWCAIHQGFHCYEKIRVMWTWGELSVLGRSGFIWTAILLTRIYAAAKLSLEKLYASYHPIINSTFIQWLSNDK